MLHKQIVNDCSEILHDQIENTSSIFTYEALSKSDPANFAQLVVLQVVVQHYVVRGAMHGMLIHPDMQSLVICDFDNNIFSFGIYM